MRPAEILVELLLGPRAFAVVFGRDLPEDGYYVVGDTEQEIFSKLATGFGTVHDGSTKEQIESWIARGATVLLQRNNGSLMVYGQQLPQLPPSLVNGLELDASTPVTWVHFVGNQTGADKSTAGQVLGVRDRQTKLTRAQAKAAQDAEEQAEFDAQVVAAEKNKGMGGLASTSTRRKRRGSWLPRWSNKPPVIKKQSYSGPVPPVIPRTP